MTRIYDFFKGIYLGFYLMIHYIISFFPKEQFINTSNKTYKTIKTDRERVGFEVFTQMFSFIFENKDIRLKFVKEKIKELYYYDKKDKKYKNYSEKSAETMAASILKIFKYGEEKKELLDAIKSRRASRQVNTRAYRLFWKYYIFK